MTSHENSTKDCLQRYLTIVLSYPRSLNVSRTLFFTNCLWVVFSRTLHLAREDNSRKRRQLRSMYCINLYTNSLIWLRFDFSDCLLLMKLLIIECSEILSDLGYQKILTIGNLAGCIKTWNEESGAELIIINVSSSKADWEKVNEKQASIVVCQP